MWNELPTFLDFDLMPLQKIKTPEGKKAFFVQVPILPIMDPAKVKVCIKDNCNLIVKFEHKKTIGDICSRVHYCCQVPLPKNIDVSSIVCKQKKHVLNITVPVKKGGMVSTTCVGYCDVPVHRKLRHPKQQRLAGGVGVGISKTMPMQQKQKKPSDISGLKQQKLKKPQQQQQKISPLSTSLQQQTQQKQKAKSPIRDIPKPTASTTTPDITKKKKQKKSKTSNILNVSGQQQYPKTSEGVSKGSDLLESVFGFGGAKSKQQSTVQQQQQQKSTPTQLDKGVQQSQGAEDVTSQQQQGNISSDVSINKPDIPSSSSTQEQSSVSGSVNQ